MDSPLGVTEVNDARNSGAWAQCINSHTAALEYFNLLKTKGYIHDGSH